MKARILTAINKYEARHGERMSSRQTVLQNLVDKHGLDNVALASELKPSTLQSYLRNKRPNISSDCVNRATYVLNNL